MGGKVGGILLALMIEINNRADYKTACVVRHGPASRGRR